MPELPREQHDMMSSRIRIAAACDSEVIYAVHLRAFPEGENQLVATLAAQLLGEQTDPATIALVAELGGNVVGHIAFSPVMADTHKKWLGYILAPLAVTPEYQQVGIGTKLVEHGLELLAQTPANVLFVYGDPKYYGRFGFAAAAATRFMPPYELAYPFGWQARVLRKGGGLGDQAAKLSCVRSLRDPALW